MLDMVLPDERASASYTPLVGSPLTLQAGPGPALPPPLPLRASPARPRPATPACRRVDEELERVLSDTQRRMQRENDSVFLQRVPAEAPPLPAGRRLVSALSYVLLPAAEAARDGVVERCFEAGPAGPADAPAQAAMSTGGGGTAAAAGGAAAAAGAAPVVGALHSGGAAHAGDAASGGCSCCRVLAFAVAAPLLALLWLLGALIHILLLPLKCCCPCLGLPLGWLADAMLWLMGLLPGALLWATGSENDSSKAAAGKAASDKKH